MMGITRSTLRGVGVVLLGFVACAVVSIATDALCRAVGVFPDDGHPMPDRWYLLPLLYRAIYGTAATALVAVLASEPRWRYVWIMGAVGFIICLAGLLVAMGKGPEFGPLWYPLALAASVPLTTFLGGWICLRHSRTALASTSVSGEKETT